MPNKSYSAKVLSIEEDGSAIIELPDDLCEIMGWGEGTSLGVDINELGQIILKENVL